MTTTEYGFNDPLPPMKEFELFPAGFAKFEVTDAKRVPKKEMGRLGQVNTVVVTLRLTSLVDPEMTETKEVNLALHPRVAFKLYQFFAAIGQYTHGNVEEGKQFTPNWANLVGRTGYCEITHKPWKDRDGNERQGWEIDKFLDAQGRASAKDDHRVVDPDNIPF